MISVLNQKPAQTELNPLKAKSYINLRYKKLNCNLTLTVNITFLPASHKKPPPAPKKFPIFLSINFQSSFPNFPIFLSSGLLNELSMWRSQFSTSRTHPKIISLCNMKIYSSLYLLYILHRRRTKLPQRQYLCASLSLVSFYCSYISSLFIRSCLSYGKYSW